MAFENIPFDESQIIKGLSNMNEKLKESIKLTDQLESNFTDSVRKSGTSANQLGGEVEKMEKKVKAAGDQVKSTGDAMGDWQGEIKGAASELTIMGVNVGRLTDGLKKKIAVLKATKVGLGSMAGGLKAVKVALVATGIGAFVVVLGSLVAWLTKSQDGIDKVRRVLAGLGGAIGVITTAAANFGKRIFKVFSDPKKLIKDFGQLLKDLVINRFEAIFQLAGAVGKAFGRLVRGDFKGLKEVAKEAGDAMATLVTGLDKTQRSKVGDALRGAAQGAKDLANNVKNAAVRSSELEKGTQAIREEARALNVEYRQSQAEIKELNKLAEDTNKSDKERAGAARKALEIEKSFLDQRLDLEKRSLSILQEKNSLSNSLTADLDAEAELKSNIASLQEESLEKQTTLQNKLNTIEGQRQAKNEAIARAMEEAKAALQSELEALEKKIQEVELARLSPEERVKAEFDIAKAAIDAQFEKLEKLNEFSKAEIDLAKSKNAILEALEEEFLDNLAIANREGRKKIELETLDEATTVGKKFSKQFIDATANELKPSLDDKKPKIIQAFENLKDDLLIALNISKEDANLVLGAIGSAVGAVWERFNEQLDAQIEENEAKLNDIDTKRAELEERLKVEEEANKDGLASRVQGTKDALATLNKEEAKAINERDELQKKSVRNQMIQNALSQASNLVTAGSKIFEANSGFPIVGVVLAVAAIASMITAFSRIKQQANAATRLWRGGDLGEALGATRKGTDRSGVGDGYLLEGTNVRIGGDEGVINGTAWRRNRKFFDRANRGEFDGVDLNHINWHPDLGHINGNFSRRSGLLDQSRAIAQQALMKRTFSDYVDRQTKGIVKAIKDKPILLAVGDGQKVLRLVGSSLEIEEV